MWLPNYELITNATTQTVDLYNSSVKLKERVQHLLNFFCSLVDSHRRTGKALTYSNIKSSCIILEAKNSIFYVFKHLKGAGAAKHSEMSDLQLSISNFQTTNLKYNIHYTLYKSAIIYL